MGVDVTLEQCVAVKKDREYRGVGVFSACNICRKRGGHANGKVVEQRSSVANERDSIV